MTSELPPEHAIAETGDSMLTVKRIITPVLRRWRILVVGMATAAGIVGVGTAFSAQQYRAELSFSTISSNRASATAGSLPAALLAATMVAGLQASPALLSRLVRSQNVEARVARLRVTARADSSVADVLFQRQSSKLSDPEVIRRLRRVVTTSTDRETGLVTVEATHSDSALARIIVENVVSEVTLAFQRAVKSQVSETRSSLSQRVDAATSRLRSIEERSREFAARNRLIEPFSSVALERDRLGRELNLAQTLYNQVVLESESAKDREFEAVPAVVIVDPIPRALEPVARGILWKTVAAAVFSCGVIIAFVVLVDLARSKKGTLEDEELEFRAALSATPILRSIVKSRRA